MHVTGSERIATEGSVRAPDELRPREARTSGADVRTSSPKDGGRGRPASSQGGVTSMNIGDAWRTLLRRWYLLVIVLAIVGGTTNLAMARVGPSYEAVGSVLVFPPDSTDRQGNTPTDVNPYLELSTLTQARDIVIRTITSKSIQDEFEERFPETTFKAVPDPTNSAPIVLFTVESKSGQDATEALDQLMLQVPQTLSDLQRGLPLRKAEIITSMPLTQDSEPEVVRKMQVRAGIASGAAALAVGLLLIALIDGVLTRRRRRVDTEES
jgi:uncharacterized protein involved in exopolysaccharide biosynthesis